MRLEELKVGGRYNWKNQTERLVYLGRHKDNPLCRGWFQFATIEEPSKVWCEVRLEDLDHFEATETAHGIAVNPEPTRMSSGIGITE